jgi:hypothetical protein
MSRESRMLAGVLLVVIPTVMYGGLTLLYFLTRGTPGYADNPLRHDMFRAGHAHAGVYLVLSLVMLRYVDEAALSAILHNMGLTPEDRGFLTLESPNGFIGHRVPLVVPGWRCEICGRTAQGTECVCQ